MENNKYCYCCDQTKPVSDFHFRNNTCKSCKVESQNERRKTKKRTDVYNPERQKAAKIKHTYGLSYEQYQHMLQSQSGCCDICGGTNGDRPLHIDHDHLTGKVRALLCVRCNHMLGNARDSPNILRLGAKYLERHGNA